MPLQIEVIINASSGLDDKADIGERVSEIFQANGVQAKISLAKSGDELLELIKKAAGGTAEIIVGGGGDGTIAAVASEIVGTEKTLGVLPLGTLNHFAKDLKIPLGLAEAVKVILANNAVKIDVGTVNDRIFINNSSIGLYPRIVRRREMQQNLGRGKWYSLFWATIAVLKKNPFFAVRLSIEGEISLRRTPFVFVGNNEYEMDLFSVGTRRCLDAGKLSIYTAHRQTRAGLIWLAVRGALGRLKQAKDFDAFCGEEVLIETKRKQIRVATDGEVTMMETPLDYRIRAAALRVIVPAENKE